MLRSSSVTQIRNSLYSIVWGRCYDVHVMFLLLTDYISVILEDKTGWIGNYSSSCFISDFYIDAVQQTEYIGSPLISDSHSKELESLVLCS